jgi:acetolactate synthase-1/2/3 large subunit
MKVTDVIAEFVSSIGTSKVFGISGGASLHLLNSIQKHEHIDLVCLHHEQSVAMAAEAYSRISGKVGVGIVTSGPGATNLITGIAGAYYDSIPVIYFTGQVSTTRRKGTSGVRQRGFQETPIVEMVREVTKFAYTIQSVDEVIPMLQKAYDLCKSGRSGPVLLDIPDDIQRMSIDHEYSFLSNEVTRTLPVEESLKLIDFRNLVINSKKPVIVLGAGLSFSEHKKRICELLLESAIPITTTWGAKDLISGLENSLIGTFGTHGSRFANEILFSCDLVISIGSRLDLKATGTPVSTFAPEAKKVMFDIDLSEINKFQDSGLVIDLSIPLDLNDDSIFSFLEILTEKQNSFVDWSTLVLSKKLKSPSELRTFSGNGVNPYNLMSFLSQSAPANLDVFVDTGCAVAWTMQAWNVKPGQRIFHDFNNTAMGWSIPATIASTTISDADHIFTIIGDGSVMMALGDLANISGKHRAVSIFLLNNGGYAMIKQTQDQWFDKEYFASSVDSDLNFPNFRDLATSFGFSYHLIENDEQLSDSVFRFNQSKGIIFYEVKIQENARVIPIVKFGNPNHIMEPSLDDD